MNETVKQTKQINTLVLAFITLIDLFLVVGYLKESRADRISVGTIMAFITVILITLGINAVLYFKNKSSEAFRHISVIGYAVVYIFALYFASNDMVFAIIFPMTMIYILYFDLGFFKRAAICSFLVNVADIIKIVRQGYFPSKTPVNVSLIALRLAAVGLTLGVVY